MATKTKNKTFDPHTQIHPLISDFHGGEAWYLQRVFRDKLIGRIGEETVVLTQVWERHGNHMFMWQWEHHPEQRGGEPFKHQGEWCFTDQAEAREVWQQFVNDGALRIECKAN
jgi:hypothetical protein